jgi:hypothetical protein
MAVVFASDRPSTPHDLPPSGRRVTVRPSWREFVPGSPLPSAGALVVVDDPEQIALMPRGDVAVEYAGLIYYVAEGYVEEA